MYEIQKGVEMPKQKEKFPFLSLEVGDSFEVPLDKKSSARCLMTKISKKNPNYKFKSYLTETGIRFWRIDGNAS